MACSSQVVKARREISHHMYIIEDLNIKLERKGEVEHWDNGSIDAAMRVKQRIFSSISHR
jgi:hypothetical protein